MKSHSFNKLSWKSCWQFDDWTQMTSFSQIVRLYRVSERPNTGQKGHNQAWKAKTRPKGTKGDKRAIFSHVSLFFFSYTCVGVSRRWSRNSSQYWNYSRTPLFRSPKGNGKKFEIAGFRNNRGSVKFITMKHFLIKYSTVWRKALIK